MRTSSEDSPSSRKLSSRLSSRKESSFLQVASLQSFTSSFDDLVPPFETTARALPVDTLEAVAEANEPSRTCCTTATSTSQADSSSLRIGSLWSATTDSASASLRVPSAESCSAPVGGVAKVATALDAIRLVDSTARPSQEGATRGGSLFVGVKRGHGIRIEGRRDGMGDTLVSVNFGGRTQRTEVARRSQQPTYEEVFEFAHVFESDFGTTPLRLDVLEVHNSHLRVVRKETLVGSARLDLHRLPSERHRAVTAPLTLRGAQLQLDVTWVPMHVLALPLNPRSPKSGTKHDKKGSLAPSENFRF